MFIQVWYKHQKWGKGLLGIPSSIPQSSRCLFFKTAFYVFILFFGCTERPVGSYFPAELNPCLLQWELNPCLLQWKHRVLTTGPPGKSPVAVFCLPSGGPETTHTLSFGARSASSKELLFCPSVPKVLMETSVLEPLTPAHPDMHKTWVKAGPSPRLPREPEGG